MGVPVGDLDEAGRYQALPRALLSLMQDIGIPNGLTAVGYTERRVPSVIAGSGGRGCSRARRARSAPPTST